MTIQPIGPDSALLYLSPADLREKGLSGMELTPAQILPLCRAACRSADLDPEGPAELEMFPGEAGALIFLRVRPARHLWCCFADLEDLTAAVRARPDPPPEAVLYWWRDQWWLSLPRSEEGWAVHLSEFGAPVRDRPWLSAQLAEHGALIFQERALEQILPYSTAENERSPRFFP